MPKLFYQEKIFTSEGKQTVLECLLKNGEHLAHSCLSGICQSCLMRSEDPLDENSQKGLKPNQKEAGLFFACQQQVNRDLKITRPKESTQYFEAKIIKQVRLSETVLLLVLRTNDFFSYKAGQFVNLIREDNLCRSYSLASTTNQQELHFHIRKVPEGQMSPWLFDQELIGTSLKVSSPLGECHLNPEMLEEDLLLLAIGTGLAPLYGVLGDALSLNFKGKITLIHGGLNLETLYLTQELRQLEKNNSHFSYKPAYLFGEEKEGFTLGDILEIVKQHDFDLKKTHVMICGDPMMVKKLKQLVFLKGVPSKKILSDSFVSPKTPL